MFDSFDVRRLTRVLTAVVMAAGVAACDNPVDEDHEEHADPEGLVVRSGSTVLLRYFEGAVVVNNLTVRAGTETTHLDVRYLDHDGDEFLPHEGEYFLGVVVGNTAIADWEQDTPGEFGGHLQGIAAGTTTLTFLLEHHTIGGHSDFTTAPIDVIVTP